MKIEGKWYPKGKSKEYSAILNIQNSAYYHIEVENKTFKGLLNKVKVGSRLGNTKRDIILEDGSLFSTLDNNSVDKIFKSDFVDKLERNSKFIFLSFIFTILISISFFKWGIPAISSQIAQNLPKEIYNVIASNSFEILDNNFFKPSKLPKDEKDKINESFKKLLINIKYKTNYKLHFRLLTMYNESIPNAFALPSGDIIITDKTVLIAKNQNELDGILLHEIGHIVHRHSLKSVIESSFIAILSALIIGDGSSLGDVIISLSSFLITSNYSREDEKEADKFAFENMTKLKIDPINLYNILNRMENKITEDNNSSNSSYFSSHPSTKERYEIAKEYSKIFNLQK